jgi:diaphanous 1
VSLHGLLRATLSCARIPDLDDDIELEWFLARSTTVLDVVNGIVEELGLTRAIAGPGGGNVDYVMEEVWISDQGDEGVLYIRYNVDRDSLLSTVTTRLPGTSLVSQIVETAVRECPFPVRTTAKRILRFCVPDEWYRRSKSRSLSLTPIASGGTLQGDSSDYGSDEETGTAKQRHKVVEPSEIRREIQESRQSARFSLFEGWGAVSSPSSSSATLTRTSPGDRSTISVSAPLAMLNDQHTGLGVSFGQQFDLSESDVSAEFERMMVSPLVAST